MHPDECEILITDLTVKDTAPAFGAGLVARFPVDELRALVEIQGQIGNWDCDDYNVGLFNGMELALATMEGRDPQYRQLPKPAAPPPVAQEATSHAPLAGLTVLMERDHRFGSFVVHGE